MALLVPRFHGAVVVGRPDWRSSSTAAPWKWDGNAAEKRVRKWAQAEDVPNAKYRDAHVWYDESKPENFSSYKLLTADVIAGKLTAVPRAVMVAGAVMDGSRGGIKWATPRPGTGEASLIGDRCSNRTVAVAQCERCGL